MPHHTVTQLAWFLINIVLSTSQAVCNMQCWIYSVIQGHTSCKWWSQNSNLRCFLSPRPMFLCSILMLLEREGSGHRLTSLSFIWSYHLTSYMTVGKLPIFSFPNFHHPLKMNNGSIYFIVILWGLHEVINLRNSAPVPGI